MVDDAEALLAKAARDAMQRARRASGSPGGAGPSAGDGDGSGDDGVPDAAVDLHMRSLGPVLGTALLLAAVRSLQRVVVAVVDSATQGQGRRGRGGVVNASAGGALAEVGPVVEELSSLVVDCIQEQETGRHTLQQVLGDVSDLRAQNRALVKKLDAELVRAGCRRGCDWCPSVDVCALVL